MKKIININLSSRLIPIEDSAYDTLRLYLDSLKKYFAQEDGADEIMSDIEGRIAEVFQDKLKKGAHCITDQDIEDIKASMGTPSQLEDETNAGSQGIGAEQAEKKTAFDFEQYIRPTKRFYRDPDHKLIGGVCGGLGAYFNIDPVVFRVLFVVFAVLYGTGFIIYLVLWFATPEAQSTAEKLEMRGEKVDLNNIKTTVQEEMKEFKSRMSNVGTDFKNFSAGRGKQMGSEIGGAVDRLARGFGKFVVFIAKSFFYIFAVILLFVLIGVLITTSFTAAWFPILNTIFTTNQSILFWLSSTLLLGIPILSLIMFLVRKMTGSKYNNKYVGYAFGTFWVIGLVSSILLGISLAKSFRAGAKTMQTVALEDVKGDKLYIKKSDDALVMDNIDFFDSRFRVLEDTAIVDAISLRIIQSNSDRFEMQIDRFSRGRTYSQARSYAESIRIPLVQKDSVIYLPSGFSIPTKLKYRGQRVAIYIKVPKGKTVEVDRSAYWNYRFLGNHDNYWDNDYYDGRVEIKSGKNGLEKVYDSWDRNDDKNLDNSPGQDAAPSAKNKRDSVRQHYRYQQDTSLAPPSGPAVQPKKEKKQENDTANAMKKSIAQVEKFNFLFAPYDKIRQS